MATIYYYTTPVDVPENAVSAYLARPGYYASPTSSTSTPNFLGKIAALNDSRAAGILPVARPKPLNTITTFQASHGWTVSNALSSNLNDTSDFTLGSQSATFTSKTDTTAATLTKTGLSLDLTSSKQLRILMKVTNSDVIQGCSLYLSSDTMVANFTVCNLQSAQGDPNVRWFKDGRWQWVTVNLASGTVTGTPNFAAIDSIRFRLTSTSGFSASIRVQAVQVIERKSFATNGVVSFTYDDSYRNQYTVAKTHLDKYAFPGTAFTIRSNVRDGDAGNTTWLTTAMLQEMRDNSGWEIGLHASSLTIHARGFAAGSNSQTGTVYGTNPLSTDELENDMLNQIDWMMQFDLTDGFLGHCYPLGRFTPGVARQVQNHCAYARANTGTTNGSETIPPADPYALRSYYLDNTTVLGNMTALIDAAYTHGSWVIFTIHDIVTTPSTSTQVSTATHQAVVDYVAGKSGMRVMTVGDVIASLTAQG